MKITIRVQVDAVPTNDETAERFSEVFVLERDQLTEASVGLSLTEAHTLLSSIQESVVSAQATAAVAERSALCAVRAIPPSQGHPNDHRSDAVRDAAPGQPALHGVSVSSR